MFDNILMLKEILMIKNLKSKNNKKNNKNKPMTNLIEDKIFGILAKS